MRCQRGQRFLVARGEGAYVFVEHFKSADDLALMVAHGNGQDISRSIARLIIDGIIETRVAVGVSDVDGLAGERGRTGDPEARVKTENLIAAQGHFGPEFVAFTVQQKNAGAVAGEKAYSLTGNEIEQGSQIVLRIHLLTDRQNGG